MHPPAPQDPPRWSSPPSNDAMGKFREPKRRGGGTAKLSEVYGYVGPTAGAPSHVGGPSVRGTSRSGARPRDVGCVPGILDGDWRIAGLGLGDGPRGLPVWDLARTRVSRGRSVWHSRRRSCRLHLPGGRSPWRTVFDGCLVRLPEESALDFSCGDIRTCRREWVGSATRY